MAKGLVCTSCFVSDKHVDPLTGVKYKLDALGRDRLCRWLHKTDGAYLGWMVALACVACHCWIGMIMNVFQLWLHAVVAYHVSFMRVGE